MIFDYEALEFEFPDPNGPTTMLYVMDRASRVNTEPNVHDVHPGSCYCGLMDNRVSRFAFRHGYYLARKGGVPPRQARDLVLGLVGIGRYVHTHVHLAPPEGMPTVITGSREEVLEKLRSMGVNVQVVGEELAAVQQQDEMDAWLASIAPASEEGDS